MTTTLKVLAQALPTNTTLTDVYTVPGATQAVVSSVVVCNETASSATVRVSIAVAGAADVIKQYIVYDYVVGPNETHGFPLGITLGAADVIRFKQGTASACSINIFGQENS